MKKTILLFFSFAIIMAMMFVGCNTDCGEQNKFCITYHDELGADNSVNPKTFTVKDKVTLQNLKKSSYTFDGWYDASTDGNKVTGWDAGEKTSDVELWAKWNAIWCIDENGDIWSGDTKLKKTSMVTVLDTTTDFPCDQSKGAFISERGTVSLSAYAIGRYEVTQGLFEAVMGTNPSFFTSSYQPLDSKNGLTETDALLRPVECVNWYDAITFCNKLSLLLGKTPCYSVSGITDWASLAYNNIPTSDNSTWNDASCDFNADGYRLPTEAEWECAARGGKYSTATPWTFEYSGSNNINDVAWYEDNSNTHIWEVGLKQPNSLSLFDMSGNVYEWCWDCSETSRIDRGGGLLSFDYRGAVDECHISVPVHKDADLGFRLVCSTR